MQNKKVLVVKDRILSWSEVFIKNQVSFLSNYKACLLGTRLMKDSIDLSNIEYIYINDESKLRIIPFAQEILFKLFGIPPNRIMSFLYKWAPHIVHAHFGMDAYLYLNLIKKLKVPFITTCHGFDVVSLDSKKLLYRKFELYRKNLNVLINHCSLFIAVSNFIRNKMIEKGFPNSKVITHYIGIDTDFFRTEDFFYERKNIILFVGRLIELKGCQYLIDALNKIKDQLPNNVELHIIGDGPYRSLLEKKAKFILDKIKVIFHGSKDPLFIREMYSISKIFCVPSTKVPSGGPEALGLVFLEAQACGTPVVSFNIGGIPEAVVNEKTGILVEDKNIDQLSKAIFTLFTNEDLWKKYSINGRKYVTENFDIKKQTKKLEEIYDQIIINYYNEQGVNL